MDELPKDRCCSPNVTAETAWAVFVELEPFENFRTAFMFWKGDRKAPQFKSRKARIRDLRPGDVVVFEGWRRKVAKIEIYR